MLKLYSAPRTRSLRVAWVLHELKVDYELIEGEFLPTRDEFFIQQTPTGKYPTIEDDGFVMFESGAIVEYLLDKFDGRDLAPARGTRESGEYLQWLHFADATAFAPLGIIIWLAVYRSDAADHPHLVEDARERARTGLKVLETHLSDREWLVNERFSAADIMMGFTLLAARLVGIVPAGSVLGNYLNRLLQRPALQLALQRCGGDWGLA